MRFRYSTEANGKLVKKAAVYTRDEHKINFADVDTHAVYITERLQAYGFETYIVGGAVRDLLLGKKPKDFDIATSASPGRIKKIFRNARIIGRRFRLVHVSFGSKIIEVSTFRSLKDGPTSNTFGSIDEDVLRRDFTLNALFYNPAGQLVIDYVGGMKDIRKKLVRPIIPLSHIFTDDPVRILRAVKYAAICDFKLPMSLKGRIKKNSPLLDGVPPSRLTEEIFKIIHSPHASNIIKALDALGIYHYLQPRAVELFKTRPGFKTRYLNSFAALSRGDVNSSEAEIASDAELFSALIKDYIQEEISWDDPAVPIEKFRNAFSLARKFVLPMNPPKVILYNALRKIFSANGITIKRTRYNDSIAKNHSVPAGDAVNVNEGKKRRRKRSRHKIAQKLADN